MRILRAINNISLVGYVNHEKDFWKFCGYCCDMSQNDTIGKIELNPSFVLSSDNTNYKNDIQLFFQLFDELRVNGDYH